MTERGDRSGSLDQRLLDVRVAERALSLAVSHALEQHKQAGNPVAEWRDGKVVWIAPEDIVVPLSL